MKPSRLGVSNTPTASLQRIRPYPECPGYDTKQSDGKTRALEIWGMWSTPSLPLLPGPLKLGMIALDRVLSMVLIEQTVCANK